MQVDVQYHVSTSLDPIYPLPKSCYSKQLIRRKKVEERKKGDEHIYGHQMILYQRLPITCNCGRGIYNEETWIA